MVDVIDAQLKVTKFSQFSVARVAHTMFLWSSLLILATFIYWKLIRPHSLWSRKGVKHLWTPPILGDYWKLMFKRESIVDFIERMYNAFPEERYCGAHQTILPTLIVRDPELIKQIAIKDFEHFADHMHSTSGVTDSMITRSLFAASGKRWHNLRTILSPAFTSGKMRAMFVLISEAAERFVDYFEEQSHPIQTVELKDIFTRFANDVIATCSFGVTCDSMRNEHNEFYETGKEAFSLDSIPKVMRLMMVTFVPNFAELFSVRFFTTKIENFFKSLISEAVDVREKHGVQRPDMIHLLMEARKGRLAYEERAPKETGFATAEESEMGKGGNSGPQEISISDMTAQALLFFFAGIEPTSGLMSFLGYQLAIDQEIQRRLRDEIDDAMKECGGKPTYEVVTKLKYLDMVVSECLRFWPITAGSERICTKTYTIKPVLPHEKPVTIEKGVDVFFAIRGIHRDPKYFPDPVKFDPERFSDKNKDKIKPYTYLPFGVGARNCIGSRFALLETKAVFVRLLSRFEILPNERTEKELTFAKAGFAVGAQNGFWVDFKRRQ